MRFTLQGRESGCWFWSAHGLITAADLIYGQFLSGSEAARKATDTLSSDSTAPTLDRLCDAISEVQLGPVSVMLLGFAIENTCKGILIERNPDLVEDATLKKELRSHDLPRLVTACGFVPETHQAKSLSFLSEYVRWAGRYPIPVTPLAPNVVEDKYRFYLSSGIPVESLWNDARPVYTSLIGSTKFRFPVHSPSPPSESNNEYGHDHVHTAT